MNKIGTTSPWRLVWAGLAVAVAMGPGLAHDITFEPLGVTCGPAFFPRFCVLDLSGDGKTLLYPNALWTEAGGFVPIGGPAEGYQPTALSNDGSTVVGDVVRVDGPLGLRVEAAIWRGGDVWQPLGGLAGASPCGDSLSSAYDVSNGGTTVVGLAWIGDACSDAHAFSWNEATGMVDLGSIVEGRASRANVISPDSTRIAGWSDSEFGARLAAKWDDGAAAEWLTQDTASTQAGEAIGISGNGKFLVGADFSSSPSPGFPNGRNFEPWLWSEQSGLIGLGIAKGLRGDVIDGQHVAIDVSNAGDVVVGQTTLFNLGEQWAFIWLKTEGTRLLQDYVRAHTDPATAALLCPAKRGPFQPDCTRWDLWNVAAVSDDGKVLVGTGRNPDGLFEAYKITLP